MRGRTHLGFEIVERVRHLFVRQDEADDLDKSAAGKAENRDVRHWVLQAAASLGFARKRHSATSPRPGERAKCSAWANALGWPGDCLGARQSPHGNCRGEFNGELLKCTASPGTWSLIRTGYAAAKNSTVPSA